MKAGLCERPEDWQWSSFRHYATGAEGRVEIESEWTARKRERETGTLCTAVELPHSSQKRAGMGHRQLSFFLWVSRHSADSDARRFWVHQVPGFAVFFQAHDFCFSMGI